MSATPLDTVLAEARRALNVGDVPALVDAIDRYDQRVAELELVDDLRSSLSWPLRLAALRSEGRPEEVLALGSRYARRSRQRGWTASVSDVLCLMGRAALDLSDYRRAQVWFEEAFVAADIVDDDNQRASAVLGSAILHEVRGDTLRFRQEAERALGYASRGPDLVGRAEVLTALGRARLRLDDPRGDTDLAEAEALLEQAGAHAPLLKNLLDRLVTPMSSGDLDAAEALLSRAEALLEHVRDPHTHGRVALDRGELLRLSGDIPGATRCYLRALERFADGHPLRRVTELNLAIAQVIQQDVRALRKNIPRLLARTRGHGLHNGLTHLMALAIGPLDKHTTEDELWATHGTPARLPLRDAGNDPDVALLAQTAARRMLHDADPVQAGRAALTLGIGARAPDDVIRALRHSRGAVPIGPFLALQRLGAGGMGEVWLGRHVDSDLPAAVKVVSPSASASEVAFASFDNELRAVATLNHPNIVRLLDHGLAGRAAEWMSGGRIHRDSPYLALEYVRGGTISSRMGKLPWPAVRRVLTDLLEALAHAHARRVLHLDLKPDNVLLNQPGDPMSGVRLTDFGLALLRDQARDAVAGTRPFMAPEQFDGKNLGTHTDLYALGCMAWGLVTNRAPFESDDPAQIEAMHRSAPLPAFEPVVDVPPGLLGWLRRLLAKSPRARFTRAIDALRALDALDPEPRVPPDPDTHNLVVIAEAGLSLAQERQPHLVGHAPVREALWRSLLSCRDTARPGAVELRGPLGSGRHAVATWLATRAHEEGIAEVLWPEAEAGLSGLLGGDEAVSAGALALRLQRHLHAVRNGRVAIVVIDTQAPRVAEVVDILLREGDGPIYFVTRGPPGRLRRNRAVLRVELEPLGTDEMRALVRALLPLRRDFEHELVRWAGGNPGLAVATLRQMANSGALQPSREGWGTLHDTALKLPRALRGPIDAQLRQVADTPERWDALQLAAALGPTFPTSRWHTLAPAAPGLEAALFESYILHDDQDQRRWLQPAARHLLDQDRSIRLAHGRIAEHLREQGAPARDVARHFVEAHLFADAHRPLLDAITEAHAHDDLALAKRLYRRWREVLDRLAATSADPRRLAGEQLATKLGLKS